MMKNDKKGGYHMSETRIFELKCVIENIQLEIDFTDLTEEEEKLKTEELKRAKQELMQLQK